MTSSRAVLLVTLTVATLILAAPRLEHPVRATDPHEPVSFERAKESPLETRVFRVESNDDTRQVIVILRAIYRMRDMTELADESRVSVRAALPLLDASEALLREVGLLVE